MHQPIHNLNELFLFINTVIWKKMLHKNNVLVLLGFFSRSLCLNGLRVISAPQERALVVHLIGLVAQKHEAIIIDANLNLFGA